MRHLLLAALLLAAAGCGAQRTGHLERYSRVAVVGEHLPDDAARLRIGLSHAGLTVVDEAEAKREPAATLACQADILEGGIRTVVDLHLLDYATRSPVWHGRYSRKLLNARARVIQDACDELGEDLRAARPVAAR